MLKSNFTLARAGLMGSLALLTINSNAQGTSQLDQDEHHNIEEITVTATPLKRAVEQLAQPTSVLSGDELARKTASSLGETLSGELGVSSSYFGPVASRPVIRGQFGERVSVLSNGLDALDVSALSEDHQTTVEGILARRIEIVRGPASLLYGSGASGGLVNVVDRRLIEAAPEAAMSGALALNTNSASDELAGAGWVQFGSDRVALHLDGFSRDTDDLSIPGFAESALLREQEVDEGAGDDEEAFGIVENTSSRTEGGAASISLFSDKGFVGASLSGFSSLYGVPGEHGHASGEDEEAEEQVRIDLQQTRLDLVSEYEFGGLVEKARMRAAFNSYEHNELEGPEVGTRFETDSQDFRLELTQRASASLEGAFGLQYSFVDFTAEGEEAFVPSSETKKTSLFAFEEYRPSEVLSVQASARIEQQSIRGQALVENYRDTSFGASLGLIYTPNDRQSLALHISNSERHPTATELYANGAHVAAARFELGSLARGAGTLAKETSLNTDITWRANTHRVDWTVTGFLNDVDDYIALLPTGDTLDEFPVFEYTEVDARFYGFELEARIELMDQRDQHLHARLFSDFVFAERRDGNQDYLPRIPPLRVGAELHYSFGSTELSADASFNKAQTRTVQNELPSDSYSMLSFSASHLFEEQGLYVFLTASNLGDEEARQHSSSRKDTVPLPGRAVRLGLRWDF